jgi:hypothetical protein
VLQISVDQRIGTGATARTTKGCTNIITNHSGTKLIQPRASPTRGLFLTQTCDDYVAALSTTPGGRLLLPFRARRSGYCPSRRSRSKRSAIPSQTCAISSSLPRSLSPEVIRAVCRHFSARLPIAVDRLVVLESGSHREHDAKMVRFVPSRVGSRTQAARLAKSKSPGRGIRGSLAILAGQTSGGGAGRLVSSTHHALIGSRRHEKNPALSWARAGFGTRPETRVQATGPALRIHGRVAGSSRNVRHKQPVRHPLLEVFEHTGLSNRHADANASPSAVLNSTTYVPSFFGP